MVRLKDPIEAYKHLLSQISIPYGAIKSETTQVYLLMGGAFQFLMVRLKVILKAIPHIIQ